MNYNNPGAFSRGIAHQGIRDKIVLKDDVTYMSRLVDRTQRKEYIPHIFCNSTDFDNADSLDGNGEGGK